MPLDSYPFATLDIPGPKKQIEEISPRERFRHKNRPVLEQLPYPTPRLVYLPTLGSLGGKCTPQKSNINTKKWPYFKGIHLFQTIILGPSMLVFGDFLANIPVPLRFHLGIHDQGSVQKPYIGPEIQSVRNGGMDQVSGQIII